MLINFSNGPVSPIRLTPISRPRRLAPRTLRLRRDQIYAAVSALIDTGMKPAAIRSLADLVTPVNFKRILRRRVEMVDGAQNSFNQSLAIALTLIAREWVKVDGAAQAELKRLLSKVPVPLKGLTDKNKRFLRQFDDVNTLRRLVQLPERLWAEVKRETQSDLPHPGKGPRGSCHRQS